MDGVVPLIIDSFAGGGGASTGIELALGRSPDVAINHSATALAMHKVNHPETLHLDSNIWDVDPIEVAAGRSVGLLWASPDCKHFSKAKGAAPRDRNIRDLAWVIVDWAEKVKPDVIIMENVEEFRTWGPLCNEGQPIKELAGITFEQWMKRLRRAGYRVQWREMRGCDYGAPTIRKRFFMIARRDGQRIVWPKPTHGDPASAAVKRGRLLPWRTAAECIDWSLPCPSIFDTSEQIKTKYGLRAVRPLAKNTLARIARGMKRYVLDADRPFLVNLTHGGRCEDSAEPFKTITGAHRGEKAIVAPNLLSLKGSARRDMPAHAPHPTVLAGGLHSALVAPVLTYAQQGGAIRTVEAPVHTVTASAKDQNALIAPGLVHIGNGERKGQAPRALDPMKPLGTVVAAGPRQYPYAAFLAQQNTGVVGHDPADPLSTIVGKGCTQTPVAAFFTKYYGTGDGLTHADPLHTITVQDRFGHTEASLTAPPFTPEHEARAREVAEFLRAHDAWDGGEFVIIEIDGETFVVVDLGMRMLTPRELFNAQGFPRDYVIEGYWTEDGEEWVWHPFSKSEQISCVGNSVCPDLARALVQANCAMLAEDAVAA
ncbi:DNA cytosine methyltransferase [Aestuariibius sp. 2305UL40-4]|uniref:DNA cytosine methyltransferase n=1 Tax=Aestuariibius violaceus TaxID=3234132 RepID=UPI00345E5246